MLSLRIAWRYLFARKSHNAVNIISMVALCGVAVASMAMVAVMSVFNGFTDLAANRLSTLDPPLMAVPAKGKVIAAADSLAEAMARLPQVGHAMPVVTEQALAIYDDRQLAVTLVGVPREWSEAMNLDHVIIDGEDLTSDPAAGFATMAVGPAVRLNAHPDAYEPLRLYVPARTGRYNPANPMAAFRSDTLRVSAVYRTDQSEHDDDRIIIPLSRLRELLEYDSGQASSIMLVPAQGVSVKAMADAVSRIAPTLVLNDRMRQHASSFRMIQIEKWISFLMLVFILVIASFNIISILSLLIIEKEPSIAILSAMGATKPLVNRIFVFQGWLISLFGGIAGLLLGAVLVLAQQWGGFLKLGGDPARMSITVYPVRLDPLDMLYVLAIVAVVGILTGLVTLAVKKS